MRSMGLGALRQQLKEISFEKDGETVTLVIRKVPNIALMERGCSPTMLNMIFGGGGTEANGEPERGVSVDGADFARLMRAAVIVGVACPAVYESGSEPPARCRLGHERCAVELDDLAELQVPVATEVLTFSSYTVRTVTAARFPGGAQPSDSSVGDGASVTPAPVGDRSGVADR